MPDMARYVFHGYAKYTEKDCYALPGVLKTAEFGLEVDRVFPPGGPTGEHLDLLQEWVARGRKYEGATSTHVNTKVTEAIHKHLCRNEAWTKAIANHQLTKDGRPWQQSSAYDCFHAMNIGEVAAWAMQRAIPPIRTHCKNGDEIDEIADLEVRTIPDHFDPNDESKATTGNWACMINKGAQEGDDANYLYWEPERLHQLNSEKKEDPPVFEAGYVSALSAYYMDNPNEDMLPGHADALRVFRGEQKMTSPTTTEVDAAPTEGSVAVVPAAEEDRSTRPLSAVGKRGRAQLATKP